MPFQLGLPEVILVLVVALLFLGPKRLPEAGRSLGRGIREFKDGITGNDDAPGTTSAGDGAEPAAAELHAAAVVHAAPGVCPARPDAPRERVTRDGAVPARPARRRADAGRAPRRAAHTADRVDRACSCGGLGLLLRERPHLPPADERAPEGPPPALHLRAGRGVLHHARRLGLRGPSRSACRS